MKKKIVIFNDILYKKHKHPNQPFHIFIIKGVDIIGRKITLLIIIYALLCIYVKHDTNMDPLKATFSKITYIKKATFIIGDTIIHSSLAIPTHKNLNQLTNISDEKQKSLRNMIN
jgi:amino acid transporter